MNGAREDCSLPATAEPLITPPCARPRMSAREALKAAGARVSPRPRHRQKSRLKPAPCGASSSPAATDFPSGSRVAKSLVLLCELHAAAGLFELLLEVCGLGFVHAFLDRLGCAIDQVLCLLEAKSRDLAHHLDNLDLLVARGLEHDRELVLLRRRRGRSGSGSRSGRNRNRCRGRHAEFLLEFLHQGSRIYQRKILQVVLHLIAAELCFRHFASLLIVASGRRMWERPERVSSFSLVALSGFRGRFRRRGEFHRRCAFSVLLSDRVYRTRQHRARLVQQPDQSRGRSLQQAQQLRQYDFLRRQRRECLNFLCGQRLPAQHTGANFEFRAEILESDDRLGHLDRIFKAKDQADRAAQLVTKRSVLGALDRAPHQRVLRDAQLPARRAEPPPHVGGLTRGHPFVFGHQCEAGAAQARAKILYQRRLLLLVHLSDPERSAAHYAAAATVLAADAVSTRTPGPIVEDTATLLM